jgi:signal transduction histidine kinase
VRRWKRNSPVGKLSSLADLAAVAHEIRNLRNAIGMAIQRLQREFPQNNPELQKEYFHFTDVLRERLSASMKSSSSFSILPGPPGRSLQPLAERPFQDLSVLLKEPAERGGRSS